MRLSIFPIVGIAALLACVSGTTHAQTHYVFSQAGHYPGAYVTVPFGVNDTQIVGYYEPATGAHAYIQTGQTFITAEPSGVMGSYLFGINRSGLASGGYCAKGCNLETGQHGYVYHHSNGAITTIDYPGAGTTTAFGINNKGQIVGGFCSSTIGCPVTTDSVPDHGYLYSGGVFTQLDYPGAEGTHPFSINDKGAIVGTYLINLSGPHGFIYQNGVYTNIDYPGVGNSTPTAINNSGVVAGLFSDGTGTHGFLYRGGKFEKINDPKSPTATDVTGINDKNVVVGYIGLRIGLETFKGVPEK